MAFSAHFIDRISIAAALNDAGEQVVTITISDVAAGEASSLLIFGWRGADLLGQMIEQATAARDALAARPAPALAAE
jgi:hypothetical protein